MPDSDEILTRFAQFDNDALSRVALYYQIANQVALRQMEINEVVEEIAMPILRYLLGDQGQPIPVVRALCEKVETLFDILVDTPEASVCLAYFRQITAIILEE